MLVIFLHIICSGRKIVKFNAERCVLKLYLQLHVWNIYFYKLYWKEFVLQFYFWGNVIFSALYTYGVFRNIWFVSDMPPRAFAGAVSLNYAHRDCKYIIDFIRHWFCLQNLLVLLPAICATSSSIDQFLYLENLVWWLRFGEVTLIHWNRS